VRKRIFSTFGLWTAIIAIVYFFNIHGAIFIVAVATVLTQYEFYRILEKMGHKPNYLSGLCCGLAIPVGAYYLGKSSYGETTFGAGTDILLAVVILQSLLTISSPQKITERMKQFFPTLIGIIYIPFMLHFFVLLILVSEQNGYSMGTAIFLCIWTVAVAKFNDVGALIAGKFLGRHKMAPLLSPGKTWEGAVGGVLFASCVGAFLLFGDQFLGKSYSPEKFTYFSSALLAIPVAVAAIASDLLESAFKREAAIKDSGNLIPGIGGIFDLTDSIILAGPIAYLLFKIIIF